MVENVDKESTQKDGWDKENWKSQGTIIELADGIAYIDGLPDVAYGELVGIKIYEGIYQCEKQAIALDLLKTYIAAAILGPMDGIEEGLTATRKDYSVDVHAGYWALGRMINALGIPFD